jgi:hypothetical protein
MKHIVVLAISALGLSAPVLAADVGVSVSIGQPGFYGRVDIGNVPPPVVVYPQPVVIQQAPQVVVRQPIYLRVPPTHSRDWRRYCARYAACNQPVYFVSDGWYRDVYVPAYQQRGGPPGHADGHPGRGHGRGHDKDKGKGRGHGKD